MIASGCNCWAGFRVVYDLNNGYLWRRCKCPVGRAALGDDAKLPAVFEETRTHQTKGGHHWERRIDGGKLI